MATSKRWLGVVAVLIAFVLGSDLTEAQVLKARVSVKVILDGNGERPVGGRFDDDETIEEELAAANRFLELSDADWRLDLVEIIEVPGISQWYGPMGCQTARDGIERGALANPDDYRWSDDAINVYIGDYVEGPSCASLPETATTPSRRAVLLHNCVTRNCVRAWLPAFAGIGALHEIGHFLGLCHTHGCGTGVRFCPNSAPLDDKIDDTLPDVNCWNRDDIASFNFGSDYAGLAPEEKQQVETVILNAMSYHLDESIELEKRVLSAGQLAAVAAEMHRASSLTAHVFNLPRPAFTVTPETVDEFEKVAVDAALSAPEPGSPIVSYEWDFGDDTEPVGPSELATASHTYDAPGRYTIRLTVTDDRGLWMITEETVAVRLGGEVSAPWTAEDIGAVTGRGGARSLEDGCMLVQGSVGTVSGRSDRFHFVSQPSEGNFSMTARIANWEGVSTRLAKVGLMVREGLDEGARHGAVFLEQPTFTVGMFRHRFLSRSDVDGSTDSAHHDSYESPELWLRIDRVGDTIQGFVSADGSRWGEPDTVILEELADEVHVGIAASGQPSLGLWSVATICDVTIDELRPHFLRGDCNGDGAFDISDGTYNLNSLFGDGKPSNCTEACNANDDAQNDVSDAVYVFNFLFGDGAPPSAPFPACGEDSEPAASLGCGRFGCE